MQKDSNKKNKTFYNNKKVLITGHTGFKGAWLSCVLKYLGADVCGLSLAPEPGCLFEKIKEYGVCKSYIGDINGNLPEIAIRDIKPEIIIHLAAFAYVNDCYNDPVKTYKTNVLGTVNLLETVRKYDSVKSVVIVSTDKVYENHGDGKFYKEEDPLGGDSPYGCSKTCMEMVVRDYVKTYFCDRDIGVAIVRPSNVLAGGDHVKTRLIPSILKSVDERVTMEIRNPNQTRPWQSVLDALDGYLTVGRLAYENPKKYSDAWNIGPKPDGIKPVGWILEKIKEQFYDLESVEKNDFEVKESKTLGLDISKALRETDWEPRMSLEDTIRNVVDFYKKQKAEIVEYDICMEQIKKYYEN